MVSGIINGNKHPLMDTGIDAKTLLAINQVFANYPAVEQVKLYGSRAKATFHERSDIDLVVFGQNIDRFAIARMLLDFDESDIPYLIDLQNYHDLKNRLLIEHIDRVGVVIYKANSK